MENENMTHRSVMDQKRDEFLVEVDEIVAKVDEAFAHYYSKMGCRGAIELNKDSDDFSEWQLCIKVAYREESVLAQLSSSQSGGERSVATMLYLLCLQRVTHTPFRVVDEINQGMDAKNERMIFNRIVHSSGQAEEPCQYFLITPKLLPNLDYQGLLDVHFVHKGLEFPHADVLNSVELLN